MRTPGQSLKIVLASSAVSLLAVVPSARATVLQTGMIVNFGTAPAIFCFVSNLGTKPVTVVAHRSVALDGTATAIPNGGPGCLFEPLPPGATCEFETAATPVRMELEIKGSAKKLRGLCTVVSDGVQRESVELR
jgi:hypothetical protein